MWTYVGDEWQEKVISTPSWKTTDGGGVGIPPPPPLGPDQLGDRPHKSRDYIYTHSPQDLDQKNGSVNLVQSENDMMFRNIKKHIRERWKHTMSELPGKEKKVFISLICRLAGK